MWTVSLGLDMLIYKRTEMQRRALFVLAAVCALLYLCHAAHFLMNPGFSIWDCIYTFCTLAVYPLFYWHICTLTQEHPDRRGLLILLLPSAVASIWALAAFVVGGQGGTVRLVTGLAVPLEVLAVCVLGMRRLMEFKYKVENGNLYYVELDHDKGWELWGAIVISGNQFELTEEEIEGSRKEVELKRYVRL